MIQKERCFLVLLVLFLIIISFNVSSFGKDAGALAIRFDFDCYSSGSKNLNFYGDVYYTCGWPAEDSECDTDDWGYCDGSEGCDVLVLRDQTWESDGCSQFRLKAGSIFSSQYGSYNPIFKATEDISQEGDDDDTYCFDRLKYHLPRDYATVCAYDEAAQRHYWTNCDTTIDSLSNPSQGILTFKDLGGSNHTYFCAQVNQGREWLTLEELKEKKDLDTDGVPSPWDCNDDDPTVYGNFSAYGDPEPIPICGDGKLNTCGVVTNENDDCDSDESACKTNCLFKGNTCSWIDGVDGGSCCGDDGIDDLGDKNKDSAKNYVCLKNDESLVGAPGKNIKGEWWGATINEETKETTCPGDWCWVSADSSAQFHIFTIRKPGDNPYDIFSNSVAWSDCTTEGPADVSSLVGQPTEQMKANRFYCYQEGDRMSWAVCQDPNNPIQQPFNGIKERMQGDGLFTLPWRFGDKDPSQDAPYAPLSGPVIPISLKKGYAEFYGDEGVDIPDGVMLEFYVRFTTLQDLPADVRLKIVGPKLEFGPALYFDQNVLGYAVNIPLLEEGRWIRLQIPLPGMIDVQGLQFDAVPGTNVIEIRNVFLSQGDSPICSGQYSHKENSWLPSIDTYSTEGVSGNKLCAVLFDPYYDAADAEYKGTSWLGDVDDPERRCCGDDAQEYYAGESSNEHGCWNSQPIKANETAMDVQYTVEYTQKEVTIGYPPIPFQYTIVEESPTHYFLSCFGCKQGDCNTHGFNVLNKPLSEILPSLTEQKDKDFICSSQTSNQNTIGDTYILTAKDLGIPAPSSIHFALGKQDTTVLFTVYYNNNVKVDLDSVSLQDVSYVKIALDPTKTFNKIEIKKQSGNLFYVYAVFFDDVIKHTTSSDSISLESSPKKITEVALQKTCLGSSATAHCGVETISVGKIAYNINDWNPKDDDNPTEVSLYFYDPFAGEDLGSSLTVSSLLQEENMIYVMARVNDNYKIEPKLSAVSPNPLATVTYACTQSECTYPLPGEPPYTVTNSYPDLYELYFVTGTKKENEFRIDGTGEFNEKANLRAKKVAQQVVFVQTEEEQGFYGCNPASFITENSEAQVQPAGYCSVKGGKFCSYSVTHKDEKEKYTTINSWSADNITHVGYETIEEVGTLSDLQLQLKSLAVPITADLRNYSSAVVPARNILSNAEFKEIGQELPHWEIFNSDGSLKKEGKNVVDEIVTLSSGETLVSERIAVPQNRNLYFTQNLSCSVSVIGVSRDGDAQEMPLPSFTSGEVSYLTITFTGPCQVKQPMLQVVDDLGPTGYYELANTLEDDARAGAACCPQDYCWSGYACVEEMSSLSYVSEHIPDGRDYRCIKGEWKHTPVKFDWTGDINYWGFCEKNDQCLVLPSDEGGDAKLSYKDFYEGKFPVCLNSGEAVFDHYCDKGNWSSRTKFVATKLAEVAKNEEYTLYCASYGEALVDVEDTLHLLGGKGKATNKGTTPLEEIKQVPICFDTVDKSAEGKRLIPAKENTCVNHVCVLKANDGVMLATTLNKNISQPSSVLEALKVPFDKIPTLCVGKKGEFVKCNLAGIELEGDLWYSEDVGAIVYAKEGISLNKGVLDKIKDWFKGLFGQKSELSDESQFLTSARNYNSVYLLNQDGKKVKAVREKISESQQTLIAEYENFETPLCSYVETIELPVDASSELLEEVADKGKVVCGVKGNKQRVEAVAGLDFLWGELTGKLRMESTK